jgi:hypothetical protein
MMEGIFVLLSFISPSPYRRGGTIMILLFFPLYSLSCKERVGVRS